MKKQRVRTVCGSWRTLRAADRDVKRGHARWRADGLLEIIKSDGKRVPVVAMQSPAFQIVEHVNVVDSGQSVYPIIGYRRESTVRRAA